MFIERLSLTNFRCFGPVATSVDLTSGLTTFVGVNGAGKTALMQVLQRLFGVTSDQRRLRRQDFHVPSTELAAPLQRNLILEAIIAFPERTPTAPAARQFRNSSTRWPLTRRAS